MLNYKKPAFWIIAVAIIACVAVTVGFATNPVTVSAEPNTPNTERPTLVMDGVAYVNPYMPVSSLPYGYQSAGKLTGEQANNTGLEGNEYFTNPGHPDDLYTWQECGTPIDLNTVDSEKLQWAYMRWIQVGNYTTAARKLTLDDVAMLSQKGDELTWSDFERYQGQDIGSGLYIMRYEIDDLFDVLVGGVPNETPWYIYLRANNEAEDCIDIHMEGVSTFIEAHKNDTPKPITPKPDGGGQPAPEEPELSTLSAEQSAIYGAILARNQSKYSPEYDVACASFAELACMVVDGSDFSQYIYYGWALYEQYQVTEAGLETTGGSHIPIAITLREEPSGTLSLEEYWQPRDGSYYEPDIREKFPSHIVEDAMDSQKFILSQTQECYAQAVAYTGLDTNKIIGTLIETICASPAQSSNPQDYIDAHPIEYRELLYYGRYTLQSCFSRFEQGGETGLEGHIMARACQEIAAGWGEEPLAFNLPADAPLTGQQWYDAFRRRALDLKEQYAEIGLAEQYPASYLLLSMLGEI